MAKKVEEVNKREIELTDYEFRRLKELTKILSEAETRLQNLLSLTRQLVDSHREVQGRKAELLEMLADKYGFSPSVNFSLNEGKMVLETDRQPGATTRE